MPAYRKALEWLRNLDRYGANRNVDWHTVATPEWLAAVASAPVSSFAKKQAMLTALDTGVLNVPTADAGQDTQELDSVIQKVGGWGTGFG